jgi:hypothetical protein
VGDVVVAAEVCLADGLDGGKGRVRRRVSGTAAGLFGEGKGERRSERGGVVELLWFSLAICFGGWWRGWGDGGGDDDEWRSWCWAWRQGTNWWRNGLELGAPGPLLVVENLGGLDNIGRWLIEEGIGVANSHGKGKGAING